MARILVTGARGFIGRNSTLHLLAHKHEVRPVDRKIHPRTWSANIWCDVADVGKLDRVFEIAKPELVLHLAANASLQGSIKDPYQDARDNILGTLSVLQAMKRHGARRIVFSSTSALYNPLAQDPNQPKRYNEETTLIRPTSPYALSKWVCERYIEMSGLSYGILRYANVFGPGQMPLGENALIPRILAHIFFGQPFWINGDGRQQRDFIYIQDVVRANETALLSDRNGIWNIGTGFGTAVSDIYIALSAITRIAKPVETGPAIEGEPRHTVLDPRLAERELGWHSIMSLDMGLRKTAAWWEQLSKST